MNTQTHVSRDYRRLVGLLRAHEADRPAQSVKTPVTQTGENFAT